LVAYAALNVKARDGGEADQKEMKMPLVQLTILYARCRNSHWWRLGSIQLTS
jgi:hypothetical protein